MASVEVLNWKNKKVGSVELDPQIFEVPVKTEVLQSVVRWQLACRRQGTHMVKTRALVRGGGKKPFKQKGTGNARQGSSRSPLMPGGAKLFGPAPRDYSYALPKKVRRLGVRMALSYLFQNGKLIVLDSLESNGKTKELSQNIQSLGLKKAVLVPGTENLLCGRAARNLQKVKLLPVQALNVFDLLKYDHLVLEQTAVPQLIEMIQRDLKDANKAETSVSAPLEGEAQPAKKKAVKASPAAASKKATASKKNVKGAKE